MSSGTFREFDHPRGQPGNKGQFAPKPNVQASTPDAPAVNLGGSSAPLTEERERPKLNDVLDWLPDGSAINDEGIYLTSENVDHFDGRAIHAQLREALIVCEDMLSIDVLDERLLQEGWDHGDSTDPADVLHEIGDGLCDLINTLIADQVEEACLEARAEYAELPFAEDDSRLSRSNTMYYNAAQGQNKKGQAGVWLHTAGFDKYDTSGDKKDWCQTSIFYAYPSPQDAAEQINEGATAVPH